MSRPRSKDREEELADTDGVDVGEDGRLRADMVKNAKGGSTEEDES